MAVARNMCADEPQPYQNKLWVWSDQYDVNLQMLGMPDEYDRLVYRGFLARAEMPRLRQYPRFLQAMQVRLDKLAVAAPRDQQLMQEMKGLQDEWLEREQQSLHRGGPDPRLEEVRWMLEELRVSLFAQALKTAHPVSVKRIRKRWEDLGL